MVHLFLTRLVISLGISLLLAGILALTNSVIRIPAVFMIGFPFVIFLVTWLIFAICASASNRNAQWPPLD